MLIDSVVNKIKSLRRERGETRHTEFLLNKDIVAYGEILINKLQKFINDHPELYDTYFRPWLYTVEDVKVSHGKKAFRIRTRRLYGDEILPFHVIVPFLLLDDPDKYFIYRTQYLKEKGDKIMESFPLNKWKKAVMIGDTTDSFEQWTKNQEK